MNVEAEGNQFGRVCVQLTVEDDPEYRQALIEDGHDPDNPQLRAAIADVVALLRSVANAERAGGEPDPVIPPAEQALMHRTVADTLDLIRRASRREEPSPSGSGAGRVSVDYGADARRDGTMP